MEERDPTRLNILIEINRIKYSAKNLRVFISILSLFILYYYLFYSDNNEIPNPYFYLFILLFIFGFFYPKIIKPIYLAWMICVTIIGSIITNIILILVFYIILTPLSMLYRMKQRKTFKLKVGDSISFWKFRKTDEDSKSILEKLY